MVGLLGFTLNPWSKPTWFKLFRSTAHSLSYNCLSNMCQSPNYRKFLPNIIFENDSHIHVMSSFKVYFYSKINVHVSYKYSMLVCTNLGGGYSTSWML